VPALQPVSARDRLRSRDDRGGHAGTKGTGSAARTSAGAVGRPPPDNRLAAPTARDAVARGDAARVRLLLGFTRRARGAPERRERNGGSRTTADHGPGAADARRAGGENPRRRVLH